MAAEEICKETEHHTIRQGYPQEINTNNKHLGCFLQNYYISQDHFAAPNT